MYKKRGVLVASLLFSFLLIMGMIVVDCGRDYALVQSSRGPSNPVYTGMQRASGNIYIVGDDEFRAQHFPGEGTEEEPFIIDGYVITDSEADLIYIQDTMVYFEIRNCELDGLTKGHCGIYLRNVDNAKITSNVIRNCWQGVVLRASSLLQISNNYVTDCPTGFLLDGIEGTSLSGNTFEILTYDPSLDPSVALFGFHISWFTNGHMSGNTVTIRFSVPASFSRDIHIAAFYLQMCSGIAIGANTIDVSVSFFGEGSCNPYGFELLDCDDNKLTGNSVSLGLQGGVVDVSGYYLGIHSQWSSGNTLYGNDISITADVSPTSFFEAFCIRLVDCEDNTVSENTALFDGLGHVSGIYLHRSHRNALYDNTVSACQNGIDLLESDGITVSGNNVDNCFASGINLVICTYTTISDNIVMHSDMGLRMVKSLDATVTDNTIGECDWGLYLDSALNNLIFHNNLIDNLVQAVDQNSEHGNHWYHPELLEGNYWSDYPGEDDGSGQEKHAVAGDLIGDTAIAWPSKGFDFYPYVVENGWSPAPDVLIVYLIGEVQELIDSGVLNQGQGTSLIARLNSALDNVRDAKYTSALEMIDAFSKQVNAFGRARILSPEEAQYLIDLANLVIESILTMD